MYVLLATSVQLLFISAMQVSTQEQCPLWQEKNITGNCTCSDDLKNLVACKEQPYSLMLFCCYCMTFNEEYNKTVVGACQYTCQKPFMMSYFPIPTPEPGELNEVMCAPDNREGQLCGRCIPGFAPPVYSYSLSCVNCTTSNWAKYTAVSLLPVTAFFVFVIIFRVSATSPKVNGCILCIQIILSPIIMRNIQSDYYLNHRRHVSVAEQTTLSLYNIWNLDFFRLVYPPFCLQPHTDTLQVMALDYVIAVYPLLLIVLTYLLVLLYDRNVRLIVCLWKPFVPLLIRFRRQWNIKSSLIDAFATFLLLSYVKVLSVSVDLLLPVVLYDHHGHTLPQLYLFNQGNVPFLGTQHLPYACLAVFFLLVFTLLPMLLFFLYPCSCFQVCLNRTGCSCQPLHTFMDIFQGHYKDGTNGTRDLRFFSGLYLLLRGIVYASFMVTYETTSFDYTMVIIATLAVGVASAQPYKQQRYNIIDTILLTSTSLLFATLAPLYSPKPLLLEESLTTVNTILVAIMLLYLPAVCTVRISKDAYSKVQGILLNRGCRKTGGYERLQ